MAKVLQRLRRWLRRLLRREEPLVIPELTLDQMAMAQSQLMREFAARKAAGTLPKPIGPDRWAMSYHYSLKPDGTIDDGSIRGSFVEDAPTPGRILPMKGLPPAGPQ